MTTRDTTSSSSSSWPDALRQLITTWRAEADELDAATNGSWVEPGVKRACADELDALLAARLPPSEEVIDWGPDVGAERIDVERPPPQDAPKLRRLRKTVNASRYMGVDGKQPMTVEYHWPMSYSELEAIADAALRFVVDCEKKPSRSGAPRHD